RNHSLDVGLITIPPPVLPTRLRRPSYAASTSPRCHANGTVSIRVARGSHSAARKSKYTRQLTARRLVSCWMPNHAPDHARPKFRDLFNVECASRGLHTFVDEHYANWAYKFSDADISN